ncbi:MAG: hypothetical protein LBG79_04040 [Spirochaetaceae bacterium]|jgi:hypothetical protein|nr:hypothetical protein [Spirochaetaceae bacterium]
MFFKERSVLKFAAIFFSFFYFVSCEKLSFKTADSVPELLSGSFFVKPKHSPLWFEFVQGGIKQIRGPESAALYELTPWPLVPYAAGILPVNNGFVLVVNRIGFYELVTYAFTEEGEAVIAVNMAKNCAEFENWTVSTPFYFETKPAVLLDNRGLDEGKPLPHLQNRAWVYVSEKNAAEHIEIPAFNTMSFNSKLDIKQFFVNPNRFFYFIAAETDEKAVKLSFFRADSGEISTNVEEITPEQFELAAEAAAWDSAPPALMRVFYDIQLDIKGSAAANIFSSRFGGEARFGIKRSFAAAANTEAATANTEAAAANVEAAAAANAASNPGTADGTENKAANAAATGNAKTAAGAEAAAGAAVNAAANVEAAANTASNPGAAAGTENADAGGSASIGIEEQFNGYYTETPYALVCSADGRLYEYPATGIPARLPALPEGFIWTYAAKLGSVIIAAWEERSGWKTGATGIVFVIY